MLKRIGAEESGEFKAIASGTLSSGKPVVVNSDGTVSVVSETSSSESLGSDVTMNNANTSHIDNAFDSTNNKVVIAYTDGGNSSYGHTRVGTVDSSDNSINFGSSEYIFRSSAVQYISACFDSANGKIVIAYQDQGDSFKGKAVVGTISGSDISFGSSVEFQTGETKWINAVYDTSTSKVVIVYQDSSNNGKAIVGTVSGTSISFGSAVSTGHGATQGTAVYHAAASRIVAAGKVNNSTANAVVGAVSGTSISFGSAVAYGTSSAQKNNNKMGYDSASEKVVVFYRDEGDNSDGKASVGTVDSSDNSISFATAVTVTTDTVDHVGVQGFSSGGQIIFVYSDTDNTKGNLKVGTISGTTLSVGSEIQVTTVNPSKWGLCEDTTNDRIVVAYDRSGDSIANVYNPAFSITTLTSENYIGMSRGVAVQTGSNTSAGTAATFVSGEAIYMNNALTFDSNSNKLVVAYRNSSSGDNGFAAVGTVSGTDISFGTPVAYNSGSSSTNHNTAIFDSNTNRIVIAYQDGGNSSYGTAIVGTVSGTSISFGTEVVFESANTQKIASAFDSNSNKVVIAYADSGNSGNGTAIVGTVDSSDNSISFGSPVVFQSSNTEQISAAFDSNSNKVVISYSTGPGKAIVGTVSGTSISFGSAATFESSSTVTYTATTFDSNLNKIVVAYRDGNNSGYGTAVVGTVSGTDISFGTSVVFEEADIEHVGIAFDSSVNKVVIGYRDTGNSDYGTSIAGTVSGTSISFDPAIVYEQARATYNAGAFDSNSNKVVFVYTDGGNSSYGTGVVLTTSTLAINRGEVANSSNASIDIIGSVSDNQLSLTTGQQYFVQTDGTISTTADDPSVLAGTAISATELLVKT